MRLNTRNNRNKTQDSYAGLIGLATLLFILLFYYASNNDTTFRSGAVVLFDKENSTIISTNNSTDCEPTGKTPHLFPSVKRSGFNLAQRQSFGYFDDISDENWKRAQTIHARMFPNHAKRLGRHSNAVVVEDRLNELKMSGYWYAQNFHEEFRCPLAQRIPTGGDGDGPKWVCDPHRLKDKQDCLVYSFGSNGKAEFEQGVKDEIGSHCEIHTFDKIGRNSWNGTFADALKGVATFHDWGLGTEREARIAPRRFKTLRQTMKELGHENRTLDIFKIDCEWCEWFTYEQWLEQDIRQILVETHNAPMPNAQQFFFQLHDAGYVIFNKEPNYHNAAGSVEYGFLELSTDFFVDGSPFLFFLGLQ